MLNFWQLWTLDGLARLYLCECLGGLTIDCEMVMAIRSSFKSVAKSTLVCDHILKVHLGIDCLVGHCRCKVHFRWCAACHPLAGVVLFALLVPAGLLLPALRTNALVVVDKVLAFTDATCFRT